MKKHLPKINKTIKKSLTKLETTKKALIGGAFAAGLVVAGGFPVDSHANGAHETASIDSGGALLMHPSFSDNVVADHESHWSHSSHSSHYSHYSSNY